MTLAFPFETSIGTDVLEKRFPAAIWLARTTLPELGISTVISRPGSSLTAPAAYLDSEHDLNHASFKAITSLAEALGWLCETAHVVRGAHSFHHICTMTSNRRIEPPGKHVQIYLVLDPINGPPALVLNASHVLNGHRLLFQAQNILQSLLHPALHQDHPSGRGVDSYSSTLSGDELVKAVFMPENLRNILPRLPRSLSQAYKLRFKPGSNEFIIGADKLAERVRNEARPSIGIPGVNPDVRKSNRTASITASSEAYKNPKMHMINIRRRFTQQESERLRKQCKRNSTTISSYIYAAIVEAIHHHTSTNKAESPKGAHLTFPAHASRWLPKETRNDAKPAVNMAIAPASVFLNPEDIRPRREMAQHGLTESTQVQDIFRLARIIGIKQNEYLGSPHLLACLDTLGQSAAKGILSTVHAEPSELSSRSCFSTPTLTSQGVFDLAAEYLSQAPNKEWASASISRPLQTLKLVDVVQYGRATSPSVCFSLYSFNGTLTVMVHFDNRRFDQELVTAILERVCTIIVQCCHIASL